MATIQASDDTAETTKRGRASSNSPPMNNKKQKELDNCVMCAKPAVEESLESVWWGHSKCVKISADQCLVLSNISSNIVFFAQNVYLSYQVP